jgi:hypothetical protein
MRVFPVIVACLGCSSASGDAAPDNVVTDSGTKPDTSVVSDTSAPESGFGADVDGVDTDTTTPVRKIPGLKSITYYERSGGTEPTAYTFTVDGPEMTALSDTSKDIKGVDSEFYDVYYSNAMGDFELDGRYLTISGVFNYALPAGGGLNLAEIVLNYDAGIKEYGNYVASFEG